MIVVENVTVSYGGWDLFKDVTFIINDNDRIGLVGHNGAGKTTLLRLITGEQAPSKGNISLGGGSTIGYLPQNMEIREGRTVYEEAETAFDDLLELEKEIEAVTAQLSEREDYHSEGYLNLIERLGLLNERHHILEGAGRREQIERTLTGLGFKREELGRQTSEFSSGWRMRVELAKILLRKPSVMLLDEPTNHLDIESIQWLEDYLAKYKGAVVLISHDRKFLDTVTNRTVELLLGSAHDYSVPYSEYVVLRKERMEQQLATYKNQQKLIKTTEDFIERFRYKATKSNQVQSRIKQLEKLDVIEVDEEDTSRVSIRFAPAPRSGNLVFEGKEVGKSFGKKHIFGGFDLVVERGEKIAFVGRNGEGKTTMARMIVGELKPTEGEVRMGHNVAVGYYAQNQDALIDGDITVYDTLDRVAVGDIRTRLRDILGAFLFRGEEIDKKVKVLSGGERFRLAMAKMMLEPHNLLILDEPTNHIDMRTKDILKKALRKYDGTLIIISHDREFLDGLVDKVYEFRDGVVKQHLGGIYDFLEKRKIERLDELNLKEKEQEERVESENKLSYLEQKDRDRRERRVAGELKRTECRIEEIEAELARMDALIADPASQGVQIDYPSFFETYEKLKKELEKLLEIWIR